MVGDPLRIRLRKANLQLRREAELHGGTLYDRRDGRDRARPPDQGEPAVRRPDRGWGLDRERDSRLPLADRNLGGVRSRGIRIAAGLPGRPRDGLALLQAADRDADERATERCAP